MRSIKIVSVLVFLFAFVGTKAHTTVHVKESKKVVSFTKSKSKLSQDDHDENTPQKRKRKKRGLTGDVVFVPEVSFVRTYSYKAYKINFVEDNYLSFLYCVDRKRGPPAF